MNREEKRQAVADLNQEFRAVNSLFLVDYRGLKVVDATELRRKIRGIDGRYLVVKNTLAKRAVLDTPLQELAPHFEGPTAAAYHPKDVVALAKVLSEAVKDHPTMELKAAVVEGKLVEQSEIQTIASMPSREVLLSQLAFLLLAPLQQFAAVLMAPLRDLGLVLKEIKKQGADSN
jgi:large subunit ribosomal protein L10